MTSFRPDQTSLTAQTFTSTNPSGSANSRTVSSVMSVCTFDSFFGQETQTAASLLMDFRRARSSAFRDDFRSLNMWTISVHRDIFFSNKAPGGTGLSN